MVIMSPDAMPSDFAVEEQILHIDKTRCLLRAPLDETCKGHMIHSCNMSAPSGAENRLTYFQAEQCPTYEKCSAVRMMVKPDNLTYHAPVAPLTTIQGI